MSYKITTCVLLFCISSLSAQEGSQLPCKNVKNLPPASLQTAQQFAPDIKNTQVHPAPGKAVGGPTSVMGALKGEQPTLSASPEKSKAPSPVHEVKIAVNITRENMTYTKHWTGPHRPKKFTMAINGQDLALSDAFTASDAIKVQGNTVTVSYGYDFEWGYHGTKTVTFEIPDNKDEVKLSFAWDNNPPYHLSLEGVKIIKEEESKKNPFK